MEIFGLEVLKSLAIILVVILYWKFVYYKYHKRDITPILFFVLGGALAIYGFYSWFFEKSVAFNDIAVLAYVFLAFAAISLSIVIIALRKHGFVKDVDITLTWIKKHFGKTIAYLCMPFALVIYVFIMFATYRILGKEYIIFWIMILGAWIKSGIVLLKKEPIV